MSKGAAATTGLQGLGVPKSCQAAVLYYAPVAERVLTMAREREGLPQVRTLRLSHKTAHARQRSTEQEVCARFQFHPPPPFPWLPSLCDGVL